MPDEKRIAPAPKKRVKSRGLKSETFKYFQPFSTPKLKGVSCHCPRLCLGKELHCERRSIESGPRGSADRNRPRDFRLLLYDQIDVFESLK